jgi:hypothetical protein
MFAMARGATAIPDPPAPVFYTLSPGAIPPPKVTVKVDLGTGPNGVYTGTVTGTGAFGTQVTGADLQGLMNSGLTNPAGQTINFGATIIPGTDQIQFPKDNIKKVDATTPPGLWNVVWDSINGTAVASLTLTGTLSGQDQNGGVATYDFDLGYGDETGSPTWIAESNVLYSDLTNQTISGVLTATYDNLESQLPAAYQGGLELDLSDNSLFFAFPDSIFDPSGTSYSTDMGITDVTDWEIVPEPCTLALLSLGVSGLIIGYRRRPRNG